VCRSIRPAVWPCAFLPTGPIDENLAQLTVNAELDVLGVVSD
jgi:hypothetical protein